jgi:hypothetical protein
MSACSARGVRPRLTFAQAAKRAIELWRQRTRYELPKDIKLDDGDLGEGCRS